LQAKVLVCRRAIGQPNIPQNIEFSNPIYGNEASNEQRMVVTGLNQKLKNGPSDQAEFIQSI
jgi:hypothetical protein